jgi:glycoside hydrolase-like protein
MSLPGQVEGAISSVSGFDSDTIISPALAQQFYSMGYRFCLRYLSPDNEAAGDLSTQEATDILNSGLALMPVQHVLDPLWSPSQSLGQEYGQNAAANTQTIGFPPGVNVWCDLEAVNPATNAQDVVDYCRAWYQAVDSSEYVPGLYVGAGAMLSGPQLYDLPFQHYWRSSSIVPSIPTRGYQLLQLLASISIGGVQIDLDFTQNDNQGGRSRWLRVSGSS